MHVAATSTKGLVNCQGVAGDERPHQMQPAQRRWSCGEKDDSDVMVLHSGGDGRGRFLAESTVLGLAGIKVSVNVLNVKQEH